MRGRVVHGAFDRSTFGCTVIVLNPALNRNPSSVSPRYMQTRLLTVVECLGCLLGLRPWRFKCITGAQFQFILMQPVTRGHTIFIGKFASY